MLEDARQLGLIDLGFGVLTITDELGSIWQGTFGKPRHWNDPPPDGEEIWYHLHAMRYPRRRT